MDSITRNLYNGGWSLQPKYNNNRKTFLPGPQRQIKIMQSELLIGVGCGSLEASRCAPDTPAPGSLRPAGRPACAPVWVQTARPTSTWALIQDILRPKPPDPKLSSEDGGQGAVTWLPRLAIRLASFGPAPSPPPAGPTAPPTPTPHCPHPRDSGTHPCSGRRKLVGTLAEQNNLFFLLRNNVLEPRPKVTTCIGGGHAEGPGDLEQYPPLAPSLTLLTCTLERGPSLGTSHFGPRGHGPACTHKHCVMPHPWARGLDDLGWWQSLLALKSLSLFSLRAQLRCPHFAGLKAEAKGVRPGSGTLEGPPSWDSNSPPLSFHVTSGTPTEPPH